MVNVIITDNVYSNYVIKCSPIRPQYKLHFHIYPCLQPHYCCPYIVTLTRTYPLLPQAPPPLQAFSNPILSIPSSLTTLQAFSNPILSIPSSLTTLQAFSNPIMSIPSSHTLTPMWMEIKCCVTHPLCTLFRLNLAERALGKIIVKLLIKQTPEWVRNNDPVIISQAHYLRTTAFIPDVEGCWPQFNTASRVTCLGYAYPMVSPLTTPYITACSLRLSQPLV